MGEVNSPPYSRDTVTDPKPFHMRVARSILAAAACVALVAPPASAQGGPRVELDVPYASPGGQQLSLDVYSPAGDGPHPAVLLFHPGGFVGGDKSKMEEVGRALAAGGYVAFSADYRLAPEFPFPAAVDDARQAVRFVRDNAARFDVDPVRVGAMGASAGGTIAASIGLFPESGALGTGERVATVVSWSGALDLVRVYPASRGSRAALEKYVGVRGPNGRPGSATGDLQHLLAEASPITYVDASDPATLVANAPREFIPLDQAEATVERLIEAGVPAELMMPERGHALNYTAEALPVTLTFLDRYLRGFDPSPEQPGPEGPRSAFGPVATVAGGALLAVALATLLLRRRRPSPDASRHWRRR